MYTQPVIPSSVNDVVAKKQRHQTIPFGAIGGEHSLEPFLVTRAVQPDITRVERLAHVSELLLELRLALAWNTTRAGQSYTLPCEQSALTR